jgi:hypothetical protein
MVAVPNSDTIAIASPGGNALQVLEIDGDRIRLGMAGGRHPGVIGAIAADSDRGIGLVSKEQTVSFCSASRDSSLFLWNRKIRDGKCVSERTIRSASHSRPIIDVAISVSLDTVAIIDAAPQLVLRYLETGSFLRAVPLESVATRVSITNAGFLVVFYERGDTKTPATKLDVFDLSCNCLCTVTYPGVMCACDVVAVSPGEDAVVLGLDDKTIVVLKVFGLVEMMRGTLPFVPRAISVTRAGSAFITYDNGALGSLRIFRLEQSA